MTIPYGRQDINEQDIQAVVDVLKSDWLTQGPTIPRFEEAVASHCGGKYAIAVTNATSALHIACLALGVGPGDVVWTSPNTFVASSNCALYCGATVDFVDIDARTYNMSVEKLREKLVLAESKGRLPKVVIPVHFAGQSCEMREIKALADQYGFRIIEDASHAIGGRYLGEPVGNCRYSDIVIFSFHPVKIITTAEGGMAVTNNPELDVRLRLFRSHGITRDTELMVGKSAGAWDYEQIALGYNYRMTDIHAALGVSQMNRLEEFCERRRALAARYNEALKDLPIGLPWQHPDTESSFHLYPIRCLGSNASDGRRAVFDKLRAVDIIVNVHYRPVHTQPYYQKLGFAVGDFPVAEQFYSQAISIPMFAALSDDSAITVINAISSAVRG
ncbi:UDP-4-amino-4,6-dideoxy-N-acetyl-beta-L-altrosamine transaminase [Herbaspirillum autotrophicum]|uniref:UDP-4-amino-4, 6-dideoxy-N-acetyl-beta-L-altrosamine transaminase n=1 Tax=Herbaspirillum autotrophicum TaxID=180195 RepID=UPI00067AE605|nr:UDP-4-amino-4,6-dideoxy-N-acetyl-beta-L-altrosamine transaminase [Herbaspirillum autotrophicum]